MKRKLVLATGNRGKEREIRVLLDGLPLDILTLRDYPALRMPPEDRPTFSENAVNKAVAVSEFTGEMALADDSGLEVDALGGRPGVRSARYAGPGSDDAANNRLLLEEMKKVPPSQRGARFVCAVALAVPGDETRIIVESCSGLVADKPRGEYGFGYDPLFFYEPAGLTFAQMTGEDKNRVSHRGRAMRRLRTLMETLILN